MLPDEEGAGLETGASSEEGFSSGVSPRSGRRGSLFMDRPVITEELREDLNAASGVSESAHKKVNHREFLERQRTKEVQKKQNLERIKSYVDFVAHNVFLSSLDEIHVHDGQPSLFFGFCC